MPKPLVIVESPAKARTLSRFLGSDYRVEASYGHIRDLPESASEVPGGHQGQVVGTAGRGHRRRLHAVLRRAGGQEEARPGPQGGGQGRLGGHPGDRPRPRGRVDQLAPQAVAQAQGPGAADRLPRDHRGGDPGRPRARPRGRGREPGPCPGEPPHPRPPLRLHAVAGAVEEGADRAQRRPGAERRGAAHRRARGRAAGLPHGQLLGSRGHAEERGGGRVRGHADPGRRPARCHRQGLRRPRPAHLDDGHPARRAVRPGRSPTG